VRKITGLILIFTLSLVIGNGIIGRAYAQSAPTATTQNTQVDEDYDDSGEEEEEEEDYDKPSTEAQMYGYMYEVMTYAPPLGLNGESHSFESASSTSNAFTKDITFSVLPSDEVTQYVHLQADNGLAYDLRIVEDGGVKAIGSIDWSEIMLTPIGMEDYLNGKTDDPGTLVFVFEVLKETVPKAAFNGGLCSKEKTGYIAITAPSDDRPLTLAAFGKGQWPPKDLSTLCGSFGYFPIGSDN
jgi:hypothetical protein